MFAFAQGYQKVNAFRDNNEILKELEHRKLG